MKDLDLDRPAMAPASGEGDVMMRRRWAIPLAAATAVAGLVVGMTMLANRPEKNNAGPPGASTTTAPTTPSASGPSVTTSAPRTSASATSSPTNTSPAAFELGYEPLWPFATFAQAEQWRTSGGGSQPWHADAGETALSFTRGYLGFTEIDRVTTNGADSKGSHIGVGYLNPTGRPQTAAVLHLVRFGSAKDAPWEVVGSDDTTFSIENPSYGSAVSSPVTVGGHITGVDENIHVWVRSLASQKAVADKCCQPAGGDHSPWSVAVGFDAHGVLTLVASTGGHVQQVERFAIHGVHAS